MTYDSPLHNIPQELRAVHDHIISALQADRRFTPAGAIEQLCFLIFLKILDEEAQNKASNLFPAQAERFRWSRWCGKPAAELRDFLRDDVFPYMGSLVREDQQVADYFREAALEIVDPNTLKQLVDELGTIEFTKLPSAHAGGFFEILLNRLLSSPDAGQFCTPQMVREIMIALVDSKPGDTINDMSCGTGGLLVEALKDKSPLIKMDFGEFAFNSTNKISPAPPLQSGELELSGADISRHMVRIATMNLMLHGIRHPRITRADSLSTSGGLTEKDLNRKYSIILCDPPLGMQVPRSFLRQGLPADSRKSELLFTWLAMESLEPGGRAAVVLPESALSSTTNKHTELRRKLVEEFDLLAVVSLPYGCYKPASAVKTAIVVFQRPVNEGAARKEQTIFYDFSDKSDLTGHSFFAGDSGRKATRKEIAASGCNLEPGQYKPKSPATHTLQPAPTLKDLRDRIDEAIAIAGEDATWNGFDDEAIYIYHPTDSNKWVAIVPGNKKRP